MNTSDSLMIQEYESICEWCAKRKIAGDIGDPLPLSISAQVFEYINDDIDEFKFRIRDYAYALAMENLSS